MFLLGIPSLICLFTDHPTASFVMSIILFVFYIIGLVSGGLKHCQWEVLAMFIILVVSLIITKDFKYSLSLSASVTAGVLSLVFPAIGL